MLNEWINDGKPFHIQLAGFYTGRGELGKPIPVAVIAQASTSTQAISRLSDTPRPERSSHTLDSYDCDGCRQEPNVLPDGTIVPCPGYVDSVVQEDMPNLLHNRLPIVWTKSFLRDVLDIRKKDILATNPECAACDMFEMCGSGCRASSLVETGDLMKKDPVICDLWRRGYKDRFAKIAACTPTASREEA